MKKIFFVLTIFTFQMISAQDTSKVDIAYAKNLSMVLGVSYSNLTFESKPYFLDSAGTIGKSDFKNAAGLSVGVSYNFYLGNHFILRPSVEANFMSPEILYDTEIEHKISSSVFPVAIETPLALVFSPTGYDQLDLTRRLPEIMCGIRPVFALAAFADLRPELKTKDLNIDFGLGYPMKVKKVTMRFELFYSYGLKNLIGVNEEDFRTTSISLINRSYSGFRVLIN